MTQLKAILIGAGARGAGGMPLMPWIIRMS